MSQTITYNCDYCKKEIRSRSRMCEIVMECTKMYHDSMTGSRRERRRFEVCEECSDKIINQIETKKIIEIDTDTLDPEHLKKSYP